MENEDTFEYGVELRVERERGFWGNTSCSLVVQPYNSTSCKGRVAYDHSLVLRNQKIARKILRCEYYQ